ncbi:hypothetical protein AOA80_02185 [Methanomassiliicoccales archaeon RumEn M1]|jgi:hypothetical protein|nr:hypothetical protein AOA80_02185 [Methanomassiliicoccales archaeon RumEn M1]
MVISMEFDEYKVDLNAKCVCGCMEGDRIHDIYRFPNDYGASVVSAPKADKAARGTFRVYILRYDSPAPEHSYEIAKDTPLTDDYVVCNGQGEVMELLRKVWDLPRAEDGHGHGHCQCH